MKLTHTGVNDALAIVVPELKKLSVSAHVTFTPTFGDMPDLTSYKIWYKYKTSADILSEVS